MSIVMYISSITTTTSLGDQLLMHMYLIHICPIILQFTLTLGLPNKPSELVKFNLLIKNLIPQSEHVKCRASLGLPNNLVPKVDSRSNYINGRIKNLIFNEGFGYGPIKGWCMNPCKGNRITSMSHFNTSSISLNHSRYLVVP